MCNWDKKNIQAVINLANLNPNKIKDIIGVKSYDTAKDRISGKYDFSISEAKKFADYLGVSLDLLFYGDRGELLKETSDFLFN